jgi:putative flippase GtrA
MQSAVCHSAPSMRVLPLRDPIRNFICSGAATLLLRFGAVGISATLLYLGAALLFKAEIQINATAASLMAYGCAALFSYTSHRAFTFASPQAHGIGLPRFVVTTALGAILASLLPLIVHDILRFPVLLAFVAVCIVIPMTNLMLLRFWVFPKVSQAVTDPVI